MKPLILGALFLDVHVSALVESGFFDQLNAAGLIIQKSRLPPSNSI